MKKKGKVFIWIIGGALAALLYFFISNKRRKADEEQNTEEPAPVNGEPPIPPVKYPAQDKGFFDFTPWQWFGYDIRNIFSK